LREKYSQQHQQAWADEEVDPFDLFEMFFSAGTGGNVYYQRNGRVFRRRNNHQGEEEEEGGEVGQQQNTQHRRQNPKIYLIMQLLPLILFALFSIVPQILKTVRIKSLCN
jgi:hypothetical protein